ncbi:hypothetical protein [Paraburkholderia atlantica]|uniref:hypothetical protein n=1 Tax=Paraburkholderia atlantica TaxID=2654982 RepID=UPI003D263ECD
MSDKDLQTMAAEEAVRRRKDRREAYALAALRSVRFEVKDHTRLGYEDAVERVARRAVDIADALIRELDK